MSYTPSQANALHYCAMFSFSGQSNIDFLFDFVELAQSPFTGYDVLETRPRAGMYCLSVFIRRFNIIHNIIHPYVFILPMIEGVNGSLLVTVTGSASATVTGVSLVETSGAAEVSGSVSLLEDGEYLVHVDRVPSTEFVVRVKGRLDGRKKFRASDIDFQRQSATNLKASTLTVTVSTCHDSITNPNL